MREYVSPAALAEWKSSTAWPAVRGDSILTTRAKELQTLLDRIAACEDTVFRLVLREVPSHLDLELITTRLPNLTALQITYAPRRAGGKYDAASAAMRVSDVESLVRCLKTTDVLTTLALPANHIDDGLFALLMQGLLANKTVTSLDLSHNNISDVGAGLLAKMLRGGSAGCVLTTLRFADNRIGPAGGQALAAALRTSSTLTRLDLRLNALGDAASAAILTSLVGNRGLLHLSLAANGLGSASAAALARLLASPACALLSLDVSSNKIDEDGAQQIRSALQNGTRTLCTLDLRNNAGVSGETMEVIYGLLHANEVRARGGQTWPLTGAYLDTFPKDDE